MANSGSKESKWKEVKNEIQKTWGLLTHDEIEKAKGSLLSLATSIQKKYGMARHEALDRLSHFINRLSKQEFQPSAKEKEKPENKPQPPRSLEGNL